MRKTITLIIIFFGYFTFSQNKIDDISAYKAIYSHTFQVDSTDINSKRSEKMILLLGSENSLFLSYNKKYNDSLTKALSKNGINDAQLLINQTIKLKKKSRHNYKIFKTSTNTFVFDKVFSDKFIYSEKVLLDWNIDDESKNINGYLCQKATTIYSGRQYIAWFTNEIPINNGPYKFKGLPGLIIKISDAKNEYDFELIEFIEKKVAFSFDLLNGQRVTKKEFYKTFNTFKKNFISQLSQRGIELDKGNSRQLQERVKKSRNNSIELNVE